MLAARLITTGALWWWGHLVVVPVALYWLVPNIFSNNLNKNNALGWFGLCVNVCVRVRTLADKEKCYPSSSPPPQSHPSLPSVPAITWHLSPPQIYSLPPTNSNADTHAPNWVGYGSRARSCSKHHSAIRQRTEHGITRECMKCFASRHAEGNCKQQNLWGSHKLWVSFYRQLHLWIYFPVKNFYVCTLTMNQKTQYENSDKGFEHYMLLFVDYN